MGPIQESATSRFIPLDLNHLGMWGGHLQAVLKEFATSLIIKPGGCALFQGPFALSLNGALRKVLYTWGSPLPRTAQREHAAYITAGMGVFHACSAFLASCGHDVVPVVGQVGVGMARSEDWSMRGR